MIRQCIIFMLMVISHMTMANPVASYHFETSAQRAEFEHLTQELRCVVCQNQTIASSNAPLATDLKALIYKKIAAGEGSAEIQSYVVERYGDFILYKPPFNLVTLLLWIGPVLLLVILGLLVRKSLILREN